MRTFIPAGTEIAGYRVESLIGRGGMAMVYRAEHLRLGRRVALKVIAPELAEDERFRQRFIRESQLAAAIDHPNVLPIYEAGDADGMLYIAMRYVDGTDLKGLLAQQGRLDTGQALSIFRQVGRALDVAHGRELIHRDVKPGNILIMVDPYGDDLYHVYLSDFGLTKRTSSQSGLTTTGQFVGTIDYVAPEQITGKPVGPYTDIYALGCVLFQSLTGTLPFDRDSDAAILWAHLNDPPPAVTGYNQVLPRAVDEVVATAMAKAPEDRFGTCRELVTALRVALESGDPPAISGPTDIPEPAPPLDQALEDAGVEEPGLEDPVLQQPALEDAAVVEPALERRQSADAALADAAPVDAAPVDTAHPAPSARRLPAGRRLVVLAVVVALVIAGTVGALVLRGRDESATFAATDEVPLSFSYPRAWERHTHPGQFIVLSPSAISNFFGDLEDPWEAVRPRLASDRQRVVGVYLPFRARNLDVRSNQEVETQLRALLPETARKLKLSFLGHQPDNLGGAVADRVSGRMEDPNDPAASVAFIDYAIQAKPDKAVHLLLFGPDSRALEGADFDRLVDSVQVDGSRVP